MTDKKDWITLKVTPEDIERAKQKAREVQDRTTELTSKIWNSVKMRMNKSQIKWLQRYWLRETFEWWIWMRNGTSEYRDFCWFYGLLLASGYDIDSKIKKWNEQKLDDKFWDEIKKAR